MHVSVVVVTSWSECAIVALVDACVACIEWAFRAACAQVPCDGIGQHFQFSVVCKFFVLSPKGWSFDTRKDIVFLVKEDAMRRPAGSHFHLNILNPFNPFKHFAS